MIARKILQNLLPMANSRDTVSCAVLLTLRLRGSSVYSTKVVSKTGTLLHFNFYGLSTLIYGFFLTVMKFNSKNRARYSSHFVLIFLTRFRPLER